MAEQVIGFPAEHEVGKDPSQISGRLKFIEELHRGLEHQKVMTLDDKLIQMAPGESGTLHVLPNIWGDSGEYANSKAATDQFNKAWDDSQK